MPHNSYSCKVKAVFFPSVFISMSSLIFLLLAVLQSITSTSVRNNEGEPQSSQSKHGEGDRRGGRSMRLFGHDFEVSSVPLDQNRADKAVTNSSPPQQWRSREEDSLLNRAPQAQYGANLEPFANLELKNPNSHINRDDAQAETSSIKSQKGPPTAADSHRYMESICRKYRFGVLDPTRETIQTVSIHSGHGAEYYIGNVANEKKIGEIINSRWPKGKNLNIAEKHAKEMTKKTVEVSRKAMKYLLKSETNGIFHEPSGKIYMNTGAAGNTKEGPIKEIFEKWKIGALPKLRYSSNDRIHFKQSWQKKYSRRRHNETQLEEGKERKIMEGLSTRKIEEETSSEEEEPDQEQTSIRKRKSRIRIRDGDEIQSEPCEQINDERQIRRPRRRN